MAKIVDDLLVEARRRLREAPFRPSGREAALLLGHVLGLEEAQVLARGAEAVPGAAAERFEALLRRRLAGEPVAYLVGEREFYGRPFAVDSRVLIPRPESEHLVEAALALALPPAPRILDLGTGSGCLAITLALEIAAARVVAVDLSPAALAVAGANARRHGVGGRVHLTASDLGRGLDLRAFDLAVSNPPYVGPDEAPALPAEVREFEPASALFAPGGADSVLARLLDELAGLRPGTPLLVELGAGQSKRLPALAASGPFSVVAVTPDLAGIPRVAHLRRR